MQSYFCDCVINWLPYYLLIGNPVISVTARKEVILSAGFIGTTQILQLSGIGDQQDLAALGIPTIINNPSVGRNLSDHTQLANVFSVRGTESYDTILRNNTAIGLEVQQYLANHTGLLAGAISNNLGFLRLPSNSSIFETVRDPTPGPNSPHWEIIIGVSSNQNFIYIVAEADDWFVFLECLLQPRFPCA